MHYQKPKVYILANQHDEIFGTMKTKYRIWFLKDEDNN